MKWPEYDSSALVRDEIPIVIQVNGKVRDKFFVDPDISEDDLKTAVLNQDKIKSYLQDSELIKTIVIPKKLVNLVIK